MIDPNNNKNEIPSINAQKGNSPQTRPALIRKLEIVFIIVGLICAMIVVLYLKANWPYKLKHKENIYQLSFSPDGKSLASSSWDETVRIWEVATGKQTLKINERGECVGWLNGGQALVKAGRNRSIGLWNKDTGDKIAELEHEDYSEFMAISKDEKILIAVNGGNKPVISVYDVPSHKLKYELKQPCEQVESLSISYDTKYIAIGDVNSLALFYDLATGKEIDRVQVGNDKDFCLVTFSPYEPLALIGFKGSGAFVPYKVGGETTRFMVGGDNIFVYDYLNKRKMADIGDTVMLDFFAFLPPDGKRVLTYSSNIIRTFETATGKQLSKCVAWSDAEDPKCVVSPDGKTIAIGTRSGQIYLIDIESGKQLPQSR